MAGDILLNYTASQIDSRLGQLKDTQVETPPSVSDKIAMWNGTNFYPSSSTMSSFLSVNNIDSTLRSLSGSIGVSPNLSFKEGEQIIINPNLPINAGNGLNTTINAGSKKTSGVDGILNLGASTTSAVKIGASNTKLGFYGSNPVAKASALTANNTSAVDTTYGQEEADVINNLRTRVLELESKLKAYGLLS